MPENWPVKSDYNSKWVIGALAEAKGVWGFDLKMLRKLCSLGQIRSYKKNLFMERVYIPSMYTQRVKDIIIHLRKTVYINVYLHVNLTLLKVKTKKTTNITNRSCHIPGHSPYLLCQFSVTSSSSYFLRQFCGFISQVVNRTRLKRLPCYT